MAEDKTTKTCESIDMHDHHSRKCDCGWCDDCQWFDAQEIDIDAEV